MGRLADYLTEKKIKPTEFARSLGRPASAITRLLSGERGASLDLALDIEKLTGGAITPNDLRLVRDESEPAA